MRITDIFDAVRDGTYSDFLKFYTGDPNLFNKYTGLSLFQLVFVNDHNTDEKIKMIRFLILRPDPQYMLKVTQLLVEAGVDINEKDKYGAIPLNYAITVVKLPTETAMPVYKYLIDHGSNIYEKDSFGKACIDYAKEYSWRNGLISLMEDRI